MRIALATCVILIVCAPAAGHAHQARHPAAGQARFLREGYYYELTPCVRCYRCAPCAMPDRWQKEVMSDLKENGFGAFLAVPYQMNRIKIGRVRTVTRIQSYETSIYVGPFETEEDAKKEFKRLCEVVLGYAEGCKNWPENEYSVGLANGIFASLNYVPAPKS